MIQRIGWIDCAKAISIFFVIAGHTALPIELRSFIYAFHIPLFFFLSGLSFNYEKYPTFNVLFKKRIFQLLIPYFLFNFLTYFLWYFVGRHTGEDVNMNINPIEPLIGVFYGNTNEYFLHHNVPLWFLSCLFVSEMIFYFLFKNAYSIRLLATFVVLVFLGYFSSNIFLSPLPWMFNVVFVSTTLYAIGYKLKAFLLKSIKEKFLLLLCFTNLLITIFISKINGKIEVSEAYYGNYFLFWIGATSGIIFMITLSKLITLKGISTLISFIGKNTLTIFALHLTAGSLIKGITFFVFNLSLKIYENIWINLFYSIFTILILTPVALFINTYIPILSGKGMKKKISSTLTD